MKVRVKLYSPFKKYSPGDTEEFDMELEPGMTVGGLIKSLGIPQEMERQFFVNGRHAKVTTRLSHCDKVVVFPIVCGG